MRSRRLPDIITRAPRSNRLRRDLRHTKITLAQRVQLHAIAHQVIAVARPEPAVDRAQRPVADAAQAHPHVPGEDPVRLLRQLEAAERDRDGHEEDRARLRVGVVPQRRHLEHGAALQARHDRGQELILVSDCL